MKWLETGGGPPILVPTVLLPEWRAILTRTEKGATDYERACAIVDDVQLIQVGAGSSLVFGDEPFRTTWMPRKKGGLIVRWVFAEGEKEVARYINQGGFQVYLSDTGVRFDTPGHCVLFDSAEPGDDIRGDRLEVNLEQGVFIVHTGTVSPSPEMKLVLHQLRWEHV